MALVTKNFSDIITFTRASTGTFFNSAGVLTSAAINAPRFDYNPATLAARGLLIEEQRTNLLTYSEAFDTVSDWTPTRTSVTANAAVSPDGSATADALVIDTTAATNHSIGQNESITSGTTYTLSVFAKANQITQINLRFNAQFPAGNTFFDLSAGTLVNNGTVVASSITPVGNGWYRCTFTQTANATGTATAQIFLAVANAVTIATANGTDNVLIWGAQLEAGAFPTSYIPTTTTALTRSADVASVNTLSPWFNVVEGSFVTEWVVSALGVDNNIASLSDGTTNNRHQNYVANTNAVLVRTAASGVASNNQNGTAVANAIGKFAFGYGSGTTAASFNGSAVTTTTQALPSSISTLYLGQSPAGGSQKQIWLRRYTFYPRKLSNVELQAVST